MFVQALSGAASFAACLRLFRSYPLAVSPCYSGGWHRSIVLRHVAFAHGAFKHGACDGSGFYVLTQDPAERFTLRPWNPADGECQEIRPGTPVPARIMARYAQNIVHAPRQSQISWMLGASRRARHCSCTPEC